MPQEKVDQVLLSGALVPACPGGGNRVGFDARRVAPLLDNLHVLRVMQWPWQGRK
jgi:hypothetical protein